MPITPNTKKKMAQIDSFLETYKEGDELKIYMSSCDKTILEEYVHNHPNGGKEFCFDVGFFKGGFLEIDYRLHKRKK